jgi:formylglycine-generating enzyme required for sulfatase activity
MTMGKNESLEQRLLRFEQAWQTGRPPALADFLPALPQRQAFLRDAIPVDLERRWALNTTGAVGDLPAHPLLEDYLRIYPDLGPCTPELIAAEYCARMWAGSTPDHTEYQTRFGPLADSIALVLQHLDTESTSDTTVDAQATVASNPALVAITATGIVEFLHEHRLISTTESDSLRGLAAAGTLSHPQALINLARERGWLTQFQAEFLLAGRSRELVCGPYLLLELIGEGAMGRVFKARHQVLNRVVALKILRRELVEQLGDDGVARFYQEVQAVGQMADRHVVHAYDAGPIGATHFLAMEYVNGINLAQWVRERGPLPIAEAVDYARQAALALQHAHERGLVHRDVKPANLLLSRDPRAKGKGSKARRGARDFGDVKLLDLGLARLYWFTPTQSSAGLTNRGDVLGTPDYMAPEQAVDPRTADIRADLYSLGCTLFYLLTGKPPFPGGTVLQKIHCHQNESPPRLATLRPEMSPELSDILERLLAKRPEDRFQSPAEAAKALEQIVTQRRGRRPWRWVAAATALLLVATAIVVGTRPAHVTEPAVVKPPVPAANVSVTVKSFTNSIGMKLTLLPAGSFEMGSPATEGGHGADEAQHTVDLTKPFYLGIHETTVGQFRAFVDATHYRTNAEREGVAFRRASMGGWGMLPGNWQALAWIPQDREPVVCVSWNDANAFCAWLSRSEKRTYRLPTEAEWEYACRAGSKTPFHVGIELKETAAHRNSINPGPVAVGSYAPNRFGLFDMHGNVWEWCADVYEADYYALLPHIDPTGPATGSTRVIRGGSWGHSPALCRSAQRLGQPPSMAHDCIGFRVACDRTNP